MSYWRAGAKTRFRPATAVWMGEGGELLVRIPRPVLEGKPTGGWWVLYDHHGLIISWRDFRADQLRRPPLTWANWWRTTNIRRKR